jgi:hypothetical protein
VGGGTVFGPIPRSYAEYVPRQVRALARKSAFNARARENAIFVIDRFEYERPKTSRLLGLLARLGVAEQKVLVLTDGPKPNVYLSGRNLPTVWVLPYADVSTYHLLWSDAVLIESTAIGQPLEPVAEEKPAEAPARPRRRRARAAAPAAEAEGAEEAEEAAEGEEGEESEAPTRRRKSAAKGAKRAPAKRAAKRTARAKSAKPAAKRGAAKRAGKRSGKPKKKRS